MKNEIKVNDAKPACRRIRTAVKLRVMALLIILGGVSFNAMAAESAAVNATVTTRVDAIKTRVAEIQAMDYEHMSRMERKEVKTELKDMKKELRNLGGGIYISGAALLIIIILLILLL